MSTEISDQQLAGLRESAERKINSLNCMCDVLDLEGNRRWLTLDEFMAARPSSQPAPATPVCLRCRSEAAPGRSYCGAGCEEIARLGQPTLAQEVFAQGAATMRSFGGGS